MVRSDIHTRELTQNTRGWAILLAAGRQELLSKFALYPNAEARILHAGSVTAGYTSSHSRLSAAHPGVTGRRLARRFRLSPRRARLPCGSGCLDAAFIKFIRIRPHRLLQRPTSFLPFPFLDPALLEKPDLQRFALALLDQLQRPKTALHGEFFQCLATFELLTLLPFRQVTLLRDMRGIPGSGSVTPNLFRN